MGTVADSNTGNLVIDQVLPPPNVGSVGSCLNDVSDSCESYENESSTGNLLPVSKSFADLNIAPDDVNVTSDDVNVTSDDVDVNSDNLNVPSCDLNLTSDDLDV